MNKKETTYRNFFLPSLILLGLFTVVRYEKNFLMDYGVDQNSPIFEVFHYGSSVALGLVSAWLITILMEMAFWGPAEKYLFGRAVPKLLKDIGTVFIFIIAILLIGIFVFKQPVTWFWAASGAISIVIGFALRSLIFDVFASIAISLEGSFQVGDWLRIERRGCPVITGCVLDLNWRSTKLKTTDSVVTVIPNGILSTTIFINLTQPGEQSRFEMTFCLDFDIPTDRALRVLLAGLKSAKGLLEDPVPKVRVDGVTDWGVEYKVRYWLLPSVFSPNKARHAITTSILNHLHHAGISLAHQKQELYLSQRPNRCLTPLNTKKELISKIELFGSLSNEEMDFLAERITEQTFRENRVIVREGETCEKLYILGEGLLQVFVNYEDKENKTKVTQIVPGKLFGEISLLTGEPNSSTVVCITDAIVYEISREVVEELLKRRPGIINEISDILAKIRMTNLNIQQDVISNCCRQKEQTKNFSTQIKEKMKNLFSL